MRTRLRGVLFGIATALSLAFGASQALAMPAEGDCDEPWQFVDNCPVVRPCDETCAANGFYDGGHCSWNCCSCIF